MSKTTDLKYHGGQVWSKLRVYVEDFSVTTNAFGMPVSGVDAARNSIDFANHYPVYNQEPAFSRLADFLWPNENESEQNKKRLILGNGSSDLIDSVIRYVKDNGAKSFRPGPTLVQYMDYQRVAIASQLTIKKSNDDTADLLCMVNPTNPTGDFMELEVMKSYIEDNAPINSSVIVDESMLFWLGPNWREQSLTSQSEWINSMKEQSNISIFIVHSWTKIWSCCGLRIGSVLTPTLSIAEQIRSRQTPWTVNTVALAFAAAAVQDDEFLRKTWEFTPKWRAEFINKLHKIFPNWKPNGENFISWVWVDTGSELIAKRAFDICEEYGVPIRWAKYGYNQPTCVRFAVRKPEHQKSVFEALEALKLQLLQRDNGNETACI